MTAEEQPIAMESYDSDSSNDESSANEETENPEMNESEVNDEITKKFDLIWFAFKSENILNCQASICPQSTRKPNYYHFLLRVSWLINGVKTIQNRVSKST